MQVRTQREPKSLDPDPHHVFVLNWMPGAQARMGRVLGRVPSTRMKICAMPYAVIEQEREARGCFAGMCTANL